MKDERRFLALTVDLEDYRRQELRDHIGDPQPPHPKEVEHQLKLLMEVLGDLEAQATFFTVARLTKELHPRIWRELVPHHRIGCHSYEHLRVNALGPKGFRHDLHKAKLTLEDIASTSVLSFRAPYFSSDCSDPWFGEALAQEGFRIDSSRRINGKPTHEFKGTLELLGSGKEVLEVPLLSVGFGAKRISVIGGTYFRLFPLFMIRKLLRRAEEWGFVPMIYLHPYDLDPEAPPLEYGCEGYWLDRAGDRIRRYGRFSVTKKLLALSDTYQFRAIETILRVY